MGWAFRSNLGARVIFCGSCKDAETPHVHRFALSWETRAGRGSMVDRYTKAVLTVIAVALVGMLAQNAIGPLRAQSATRVVICDVNDVNRCASLWPYTVQDTNQTLGAVETVTPQGAGC